jgi:hypothetical protein
VLDKSDAGLDTSNEAPAKSCASAADFGGAFFGFDEAAIKSDADAFDLYAAALVFDRAQLGFGGAP